MTHCLLQSYMSEAYSRATSPLPEGFAELFKAGQRFISFHLGLLIKYTVSTPELVQKVTFVLLKNLVT